MKILSLVPSVTETLIECNANLIGRTRFCIHPEAQVSNLIKLGGTKDIDWLKVEPRQPDIVILDKEENTLEMAESCPFPYLALHITSIYDVGPELMRLAEFIDNQSLMAIAQQWQDLTANPIKPRSIDNLPGVIEWWREPQNTQQFIYMIWRNPWMAIGNNTFIQSVLDFLGLSALRIKFDEKYPAIDLNNFNSENTTLLFSSEPYPFARDKESLIKMGFTCALVDGELFSWYGIRSLRFLQSLTKKAPIKEP